MKLCYDSVKSFWSYWIPWDGCYSWTSHRIPYLGKKSLWI